MDIEKEINGNHAKIVLNFDEYSSKKYRNDFKDFLDYHLKREERNYDLDRQFDLKRMFYKEFQTIPYRGLSKYLSTKYPYDYFVQTLRSFFVKILIKVLEEFSQLITASEFELQVKVVRVTKREYYAAYDREISDKEHAYIEFSGLWLLNTIAMPWTLFKKIDYAAVYKFLVHELYHHVDNMKRAFIYEDKLEEKWELKAQKISIYGVLFLFSVLTELRNEGFSEFASRNYGRFDVDVGKILEFKKRLKKLVKIKTKEKAEHFFEKKLSTESYMTYYCGNLMCFVIALYLCQRVVVKPRIVVKGAQFGIEEISRLMGSNKNIAIVGLTSEVHNKTLSVVSSMGPVEFLNLYNQACDYFGIPYRSRVLWWRLFVELKMKATERYRTERAKKVAKKGYRP